MFTRGEKSGPDVYICDECGLEVECDPDAKARPHCPRCGSKGARLLGGEE